MGKACNPRCTPLKAMHMNNMPMWQLIKYFSPMAHIHLFPVHSHYPSCFLHANPYPVQKHQVAKLAFCSLQRPMKTQNGLLVFFFLLNTCWMFHALSIQACKKSAQTLNKSPVFKLNHLVHHTPRVCRGVIAGLPLIWRVKHREEYNMNCANSTTFYKARLCATFTKSLIDCM